jgi:hypothetical protein
MGVDTKEDVSAGDIFTTRMQRLHVILTVVGEIIRLKNYAVKKCVPFVRKKYGILERIMRNSRVMLVAHVPNACILIALLKAFLVGTR